MSSVAVYLLDVRLMSTSVRISVSNAQRTVSIALMEPVYVSNAHRLLKLEMVNVLALQV